MTIEERLENIEREMGRQKRRNRWLMGTILLVAGGLVANAVLRTNMAKTQAPVAEKAGDIRARNIYIEDEKGETRIALFVNENGPILRMSGENGFLRVVLAVFKDGPFLRLYDENAHARLEAGRARTVSPDGKETVFPESSLVLYGPDGKVIWGTIK